MSIKYNVFRLQAETLEMNIPLSLILFRFLMGSVILGLSYHVRTMRI